MKRCLPLIAGMILLFIHEGFSPAQQAVPLTLEAIFGGDLSTPAPSELRWAPDGRRLSFFFPEGQDMRALWLLDTQSGEKARILTSSQTREMAPSPSQASTNERERTRRTRYSVASYAWSPDGRRLILSSAGRLHVFDLDSQSAELLAPSKSGILDPKFSPDGNWISFIYGHDIWVVASRGGEEKQITFGGHELLLHGDLDWVYQEEFDVHTGYHWSPDSRHIAFLELDEVGVPTYPIVNDVSQPATVDMQRYPNAGDPNPRVRVGCVDVEDGQTVWIDRAAEYIPRIDWADKQSVAVQLLNRAQNGLELIDVNPENGRSRVLLKEQDRYWIDVTNDLMFLSDGRELLWTSDRSGFRHIYLYDRSGRLLRQLTDGEWVVNNIAGVDEENGWVYYTSNEKNLLGRDLYRVKIDGSRSERITSGLGTHTVQMNSSATALTNEFSSLTQAPVLIVQNLGSGRKIELYRAQNLEEFGLVVPEMKELKAPDGAVVRVLLYKPSRLEPSGKYPLLAYAYGMPGVPTIRDEWPGTRGLFHQFLVQEGFLVAQIDDRSSAVPGHCHAVAAYKNIGSVAAKDHELAVRYLRSLPFTSKEKPAIWGWSGGGFITTFHLTHTKLFGVGIAGAPVTDWRLYDSIYTERYMGNPKEDPDAYDRASSIEAAADYQGRLLLIHGTLDDNVHPQNTIQLIDAFIRNKKQFDMMLYPGKTHGITGAAENIHLYTMIYEYLKKNLRPNGN